MFARSFNATARTAAKQIRRYATGAPKSSSNAALIGGVAAAASVGGYFYLNQADAKAVTNAVKEKADLSTAKKTFTGGDQGFVSLKLESSELVNHNTKKLRFSLGDDDAVSGLSVASALITKYKGPEMEKPVIRPYTPTSDEDTRGYLEFIIKKYPDGPMSTHLHDLSPGQRLDIKGPIPKYPWAENKHEHIALIAGGTGITPMWQLIRGIFSNPKDKTKVTLVFGNIAEEDILLKHELAELENEYPQRFRAFYVLDNPPENWQQGKGYVTKELLNTVLPKPDGDKTKAFVCGPPGLYKAVSGAKKSPQDQGELTGYLKELGWGKEQVYKF
ncbi:ferredoxin reductase-like protein [Myriangium duriaei CBS 260.36]|uniref:NADH-cytochrome b5 reductase n=1 Tax=Myriangium duriaei CBS 260.36 TaxID=1168546 RepID=A0A9P4JAG3_9PEZI|nr:ferredoxin reductase-like protein [Myriangium duriaei CBS 260.36]